ncbi:hypothetical protein CEXT_256171 [Caerostris extrusa]|uniref:Uncharacterized protein n=1 Tax=Caerostris extrusa TaxID=172846 RepID=A0AAV4PIP8_CAEEX|nr:hypothetical protein CEXT_256171 [Caerostris extrusa]
MFKGNHSKINFCSADRLKMGSLRLDHNLFTSLGSVLLYNPVRFFSDGQQPHRAPRPRGSQGKQTVRYISTCRGTSSRRWSASPSPKSEKNSCLWT